MSMAFHICEELYYRHSDAKQELGNGIKHYVVAGLGELTRLLYTLQ